MRISLSQVLLSAISSTPSSLSNSATQTLFPPKKAASVSPFIIKDVRHTIANSTPAAAGTIMAKESPPSSSVAKGKTSRPGPTPESSKISLLIKTSNILVQDANRFVLYERITTEAHPLQLYTSSLVFSPKGSIVRKLFQDDKSTWITSQPDVGLAWSLCLQTLEGHKGFVTSATFSPDGQWLASAAEDGDPSLGIASDFLLVSSMMLWQFGAQIQALTCLAILGKRSGVDSAYPTPATSVVYSSTRQRLTTADEKGLITVLDAAIGTQMHMVELGRASKFRLTPKVSPDGRLVVSQDEDKDVIKVWCVDTGDCLHRLHHSCQDAAFSNDSRRLASSYKSIRIWDVRTGSLQLELNQNQDDEGEDEEFGTLAFSHEPTGWLLAAAGRRGQINIWDTRTGTSIWNIGGQHNLESLAFSFSPNSQSLVSTSGIELKVWDISIHADMPGKHGTSVGRVIFSSDGHQMAVSYGDTNTIQIWDTEIGWCASEIHLPPPLHMAFSDNREQLACAYSTDLVIFRTNDGGVTVMAVTGYGRGMASAMPSP
ncbi:nacht and wd domain protein [Colletotrichum plurivorum]|uniref:Mitochondrial division protein 1 n=1 Tax=Colletotrichum plurivorum TaxID=2175906 RepID=A0A8H6N493_9PEZI|nr:nacht and wd domain protein [Colletotrichum plurivorum]